LQVGSGMAEDNELNYCYSAPAYGQPKEYEVFALLLLDTKYRVIGFRAFFQGMLDGASLCPRGVVKLALKHRRAAEILIHFVACHKMAVMWPFSYVSEGDDTDGDQGFLPNTKAHMEHRVPPSLYHRPIQKWWPPLYSSYFFDSVTEPQLDMPSDSNVTKILEHLTRHQILLVVQKPACDNDNYRHLHLCHSRKDAFVNPSSRISASRTEAAA